MVAVSRSLHKWNEYTSSARSLEKSSNSFCDGTGRNDPELSWGNIATSERVKGPLWRYRVSYQGGVQVRASPCINATLVQNAVLHHGEEFWACSSACLDGVMFVKLADGRGWLFERRGANEDSLEVLELLEYKPGAARHSAQVWQPASTAQVERLRTAFARARCLDDVFRIVRRARPRTSAERVVVSKLRDVVESTSAGLVDMELVPEVVWATSKLQLHGQHRLVGMLVREAAAFTDSELSAEEAHTAARVNAALDHTFYNLIDQLVDPGQGAQNFADLVQAIIILKVHRTTKLTAGDQPPTDAGLFSCLAEGFCFDPALATNSNAHSFCASAIESILATGERCLRDPDLQFAWAF